MATFANRLFQLAWRSCELCLRVQSTVQLGLGTTANPKAKRVTRQKLEALFEEGAVCFRQLDELEPTLRTEV